MQSEEASKQNVNTEAVLTQISDATVLAAVAALQKLRVHVVPSAIGCYAVAISPSETTAERLAEVISFVAKGSQVIAVSNKDNQMTGWLWQNGEKGKRIPVPVFLDGAPHEFEEVMLGIQTAQAQEGAISNQRMSRFKALRILSKRKKASKK